MALPTITDDSSDNQQSSPSYLDSVGDARNEFSLANKAASDALMQRINPSTNWWAATGALLKPTRTGSFGESAGNFAEELGKQQQANEAQLPSLIQMRAQVASQNLQLAEKTALKQATNDFISNPTDKKAIANIASLSPNGIKDVVEIAKNAPRIRSLINGTANAESTPFDVLTAVDDPVISGQAKVLQSKYKNGEIDEEKANALGQQMLQLYTTSNDKMATKQISAMLAQQGFDLKKMMYEQTQREQQGKAENVRDQAIASAESVQQTIEKIKNHPGRENGLGMALDPRKMIPGTDVYNFREQIDQLKSGTFLNNVQSMRGLGALSNAEGNKITDAIAKINPNMSKKEFDYNLNLINETLEKAKIRATKLASSYGNNNPAPQNSAPHPSAHILNNRVIIPNSNNTGWVYQDTGEAVK